MSCTYKDYNSKGEQGVTIDEIADLDEGHVGLPYLLVFLGEHDHPVIPDNAVEDSIINEPFDVKGTVSEWDEGDFFDCQMLNEPVT